MKQFFSIILFLFYFSRAEAQFITLPDAAFASQLHISLGCVNGNQLDTVCAENVADSVLYIQVNHIHDLTGIQYFHNLKIISACCNEITFLSSLPTGLIYLDCSGNDITVLPPLPITLQHLDCLGNQLTSLPNLPTGLTYLNCSFNTLTVLPTLPYSLIHLECGGDSNSFTALPQLPFNLQYLDCGGTSITSLPTLPNSLESINCGGTNLSTLPTLPSSLTTLLCQYTPLTSLPVLPPSLKYLRLYKNQLTTLPSLPNSLRVLDCAYNHLTSLPELPDTLNELWCSNNPLTCLPKLKTILHQAIWDSTNITCVPNYGEVYSSVPPLSSFPLCDDSLINTCSVYWNITGKIFYDANSNCIYDTGDKRQVLIGLNLFHNGILEQNTFTEYGGCYSFDVSDYGTYSVSLDSSYGGIVTCPDTGSYTLTVTQNDSLLYNIDFSIDTNFYNSVRTIIKQPFSFSISPNPFSSSISISLQKDNLQQADLTITDVMGSIVFKSAIQNSKFEINLSYLPAGVYFLQLLANGERSVRQLVKQ